MPDRRPLLIAVTDLSLITIELGLWAAELYRGGVDLIQLRAPQLAPDQIRTHAEVILTAAPVPQWLQINGHLDIATSLGCGIHLPERMGTVRPPLTPASRSVHDHASARDSGTFDFVIAGHVFTTASKSGLPARGLDWLKGIVKTSPVPVVGIGGITAGNASEVIAAGAAGVAVIGALAASDQPGRAAERLREAVDKEWSKRPMQHQSVHIDITLNGKSASVPQGSTIHDLLKEKDLAERLVVVELNGAIVPRSLFGETRFTAGDQVEVVHFVGGGSLIDR